MSGNGGVAMGTLQSQIESAISRIESTDGSETCHAHGALSEGVVVLLRVQQSILARDILIAIDNKKSIRTMAERVATWLAIIGLGAVGGWLAGKI